MRYLVTGGAGFIGSHLTEELVSRGAEVTVLDNVSTGSVRNLDPVADRIELVQGSVLDPLLVDDLVARADVVVHLAAAVGVRLVVDQPLRSFLTNVRGTEVVLEAAHRYRRRILVASTSEIYGKNDKVPFKEDDDRILGSLRAWRWGYSISKSVDELLAYAYHRERGLESIVVRLFNTTGPRQTGAYGMVLPRFVGQALAGEPLTVYGDGTQTRCFCHVHDVVEALCGLLEEPRAVGEVFNVGSTEEVSIKELAERVLEKTGSPSEIRHVPYQEAFEEGFEDMTRRVPDISKIREAVGWTPGRRLDDIIQEMVAFVAAGGAASGTDAVSGPQPGG
jgi:nucleoside-diphosphate-sugar epimerase